MRTSIRRCLQCFLRLRFSDRITASSLVIVAICLVGCRVVKDTTQLPAKAVGTFAPGKKEKTVDPVELQQQLMRFGDEFAASIVSAAEQLRRDTNALDRVELQKWKLTYASDTMAIASGQNAFANLLDMVVLVTMTRIAVEDYWMPKVYGDSARRMLESCRESERKIWELANPVLKPGQANELRQAIQAASAQRPDNELVSRIRALGLAEIQKQHRSDSAEQATSVFSMLQFDPFAGLDPAAREIAQTRLFAERTLYVAQRMPVLLRWQTELLSYQLATTPEAGQVLTNLDRFGHSADAIGRTADQLPALLTQQREAAVKQVFEAIATERTNLINNLAADEMKLRPTLVELRQTLDSANEMAKSVDGATKALDTFIGRFDKGTNATRSSATNSRPFDILDYATTAKETAAALKELNSTVSALDQSLPRVQRASALFEQAGQRLLNRLFLLAAALVALLFIGAFILIRVFRAGQVPLPKLPKEPASRM